jgi:hypothetical protein
VQRASGLGMEKRGLDLYRLLSGRFALAQADMAGMRSGASGPSGPGLCLPDRPPEMPPAIRGISEAGGMPRMPMEAAMAPGRMSAPPVGGAAASNGVLYPAAQRHRRGKGREQPPMLRDEAGLLVGYVTWTSTPAAARGRLRACAAPLERGYERRRHEADRGADGRRTPHVGIPHARDHPVGYTHWRLSQLPARSPTPQLSVTSRPLTLRPHPCKTRVRSPVPEWRSRHEHAQADPRRRPCTRSPCRPRGAGRPRPR